MMQYCKYFHVYSKHLNRSKNKDLRQKYFTETAERSNSFVSINSIYNVCLPQKKS